MAATRRFTVGPAWALIATGRNGGEIVDVQTDAPIVLAVTVGRRPFPPDLPAGTGHRVSGEDIIPLVATQHLWASASAPAQVTVT